MSRPRRSASRCPAGETTTSRGERSATASGSAAPPAGSDHVLTGSLYGRDAELERLRGLIDSAREGRGRALVLLGEAGMGRTSLLRALRTEASGFSVLGTNGVSSERDLPLGGLHRLIEPAADRVPARMAETMDAVTGLGGGADKFRLCCGVHRLLTALAGTAPLLCWIDDAQWLDPLSLDVLTFVARRLDGHRVVLVLAGRPELARPGHDAVDGIDRVWLPALTDVACERLLDERLPGRIPAGLRAILVELAAGNPLDLLELAGSLVGDQLAGRTPLPVALPPGCRQRDRYRDRFAALSQPARQVVLVATAEPSAGLGTLWSGGSAAAVREALESGLLRARGEEIVLPSPVVRATLYAEASDVERRTAHATLAALLDGDRRTWHRAMAVTEPGTPDAEQLAGQLAEAARQAEHAGRHDSASRRWERAASLTVHSGHRAQWLLAAARQAWHAGRPGRARTLLCQVRTCGDGAGAGLLHGEIELRDGEPALATHELADAAREIAGRDRCRAATALMLAGEARRIAGDVSGYHAVARQAAELARPDDPPVVHVAAAHFAGVAATFAGRHAEAVEPLRRAIRIGAGADDVRCAVWAAGAAFALGEAERAHECASAAVSRARLAGEPALLPWALGYLALSMLVLDRHRPAMAAAEDGLAAAIAVAQRNSAVQHLTVLALAAAQLGDREATLSRLDRAVPEIAGRGLGRPSAIVAWAMACLDLADDRPDEALGRFRNVGLSQVAVLTLATPTLVEAAVRCEAPRRATRALTAFDRWIAVSGSPLWHALSHRCHALLATDGDSAERHFQAAIRLHRRGGATLELARTQLMYAHQLRRLRRPGAARDLLRDAVRTFRDCGARSWAERASAQLRAAGEAIEPAADSLAGLTAQQAKISRLVAAGETNREIARRLVISHRTVDHHLRNIFATLGVRSRVELTRRVAILDGD